MDSAFLPRRLKKLGVLLFLLGLLTGFAIMQFKNPRMGLAAHLEGVMNGSFLVIAGFLWPELRLGRNSFLWLYASLLYGTFANWLFTLLASLFGTSGMTPLAGAGFQGDRIPEMLVTGGFVSVGLSMLLALSLLLYGMRGRGNSSA